MLRLIQILNSVTKSVSFKNSVIGFKFLLIQYDVIYKKKMILQCVSFIHLLIYLFVKSILKFSVISDDLR